MSEEDAFADFMQNLRYTADLPDVDPDVLKSLDALECPICCHEFDVDGLQMPKYLSCCKKNICASCVEGVHKAAASERKDNPLYDAQCPYCRCPLPTIEADLKCIEKVKYRQKILAAHLTVDVEGIKCAKCEKSALKPHHRFVCLTCRDRTGEWLMSGKEEDRKKIKEGTLCASCSYRHVQYHDKKGGEREELRPLHHIFGYARRQVETASEELLSTIQKYGYQPSTLCILYSLWKDERAGRRIEASTIKRIIEVVDESRKSLVTVMKKIPEANMEERAQIDFVHFFPALAEDLIKWSKEILKDPEHNDAIANWACLVSQLLLSTMQFVDGIVPKIIDELWVLYLHELVLKLILPIVRRGAVDDKNRVKTIMNLYNTCKYTELSWKDLAYGRLFKRELMCISEYSFTVRARAKAQWNPDEEEEGEFPGGETKKLMKRFRVLAQMYEDQCEKHEEWRGEKWAKPWEMYL